MKRVVDDQSFRMQLTGHPWRGRCRVQILRQLDQTVVLLTQLFPLGEGTSLTNGAEYYADAIRTSYLPDATARPSFVQHYIRDPETTEWGKLLLTTFDTSGCAHWGPVSQEVKDVLWRDAEPGRGRDYKPEPPTPSQGAERWVAFPVTDLPRPYRLNRTDCMKPGIGRSVNRLLQRLGRRRCTCWYHQGDWEAATSAAIDALTQAHAEAGPAQDASAITTDSSARLRLTDQAMELLDQAIGSDSWTAEAARTLIGIPIYLDDDLEDYINGQHRSEAMKDQRTGRVPLLVWISTNKEPPDLDFFAGTSTGQQDNLLDQRP